MAPTSWSTSAPPACSRPGRRSRPPSESRRPPRSRGRGRCRHSLNRARGPRRTGLPRPIGQWTERLFEALRLSPDTEFAWGDLSIPGDPIADLDLQLALYVCYELHYAGFDGVDERWECYDGASLRRLLDLLDEFDLVRPQNYFDPLPWHARSTSPAPSGSGGRASWRWAAMTVTSSSRTSS
jgi:hypothetical protein